MNDMTVASRLLDDTSIAARAMKAVFHRGMGASRRSRDSAAEDLVKQQFGDQGQIVTRKLFTNKQGLMYLRQQLANEMYAFHIKTTLPHGDDGSRLLPNTMYLDYTSTMASFERRLASMDAQIISSYPQLVADDVAERNAALIAQNKAASASPADYPPIEDMQRHLYVEWVLEPIPTAGDFRYEVDEVVRQRYETALAEMQKVANADLFVRMLEPMKRFVDKLSVPISEGKEKNKGEIFRDSLIGNLNELVESLPKLNITDDPRVNDMVQGIEAVIKPFTFNPAPLREQQSTRQAARDKMAELMKRFEGYGFETQA
jgi:hypothetical protein